MEFPILYYTAAISVSRLPVEFREIAPKFFSPQQVYGKRKSQLYNIAPPVEIPNIKAMKTAKSIKIKKIIKNEKNIILEFIKN